MVEVTNLTKKFGEKVVVDNTTWTAKDGHITGFIGHNGAGKTTSLKMITGALKPTEGTIKLNGIDIRKDHLEAKKQFGYVSDSPDHFLRLQEISFEDSENPRRHQVKREYIQQARKSMMPGWIGRTKDDISE